VGIYTMLGDSHTDILARLMDVSSLRAKVHAANLANQNTPGYKAQRVEFDAAFQAALDAGGDLDAVQPEVVTAGGGMEQADGNNVSVDREVLDQAQNAALYNSYATLAQGRKKLLTIAITASPGG
jgi:flagellar basal-body rod protein FlgB